MNSATSRTPLVISAVTAGLTLLVGAQYRASVAAGFYVGRLEMVAIGAAVLLGAVTVSGTVVAGVRLWGWAAPHAVTYHGQEMVNASVAAFAFGMFVYLAVYPLTPWVFDVVAGLALAFGILLMLPIGMAESGSAIATLNALAGVAAAAAGLATGNGRLTMAGALVAATGATIVIAGIRPTGRSVARVLLSAFMPAESSSGAH